MVAYGGAGGVPMAAPFNCLNVIPQKEKMLFNITSLAISMIAVFVGMFVNIEIVSAVKSFALGGYVVDHSS